jgi:putative peptidoglycan lipid II flippase
MADRSVRQIASAAGVVSLATLLSRILGFARDMALAWLFGAGMMADAFFAAFRIPSTLRELLGEGALSAAFIPTFTRTATREGPAAAWRLVAAVMGTLMVVLAAVTLLGVLFAPALAGLIAAGFAAEPGKLELTARLLRLMFPYIFVVGLAALFMGILNSLRHFLTPALSPTILNVAMLAGIALAAHTGSPMPVAAAVLVGGAGQLLLQVPAAWRRGWRPALRFAPRDPGVRHIARLMLPGVGGLAITQINVVVGTLLASFLAEGSVSAMTYALRLIQFPIGMIGVAIATGALPVMSEAVAREAPEELTRALQDSLRLAVFLTLPAMVGLLLFRVPIVAVLFERGAFTRAASTLTAAVLLGYALGLVFYVSNRILAPAFYAMHDTWTPVSTGMLAVAVNLLASLLLMRPLGAAGLALATAIASAANFVLLVVRLRQRMGRIGGRAILRGAGTAGLACLPVVAWGLLAPLVLDVLAPAGTLPRVLRLALHLGGAGLLYLGTAAVLGAEELGWTRDILTRRRLRRPGA